MPELNLLGLVQEEQAELQIAASEAEAAFEEVEGELVNNLRKRQAELEEQLAQANVAADE